MESHQAGPSLQQRVWKVQSLSRREDFHHVCRQEEVPEQANRNNAEVSSQGRSLAEEQVIWQFFLKRKINKRHSNSPKNISVKSNENNSTSKRYSNVFIVSASDELSQSRSQETNGKANTVMGLALP